ncbi:carbonic anhydrase [Pseudomonas turukhanskensis]|uniref:carbonic anhydrase n=1 Tax=Pseudomonas turukhanskensis TaxID=1806536 RepID=A0A9W6NEL7_9PSED|nr:carbonic anhydrase family protein [Pseudomonas turukhanskensis]GLK88824.1 carbonic anhydrase [Pseudomonas turukhanskensis]
MKRVFAFSATLLATCVMLGNAQADDHAHWGYEGAGGPEHWAELDPANAACRASQQQSPVDIKAGESQRAALPTLDFDYKSSSADVVNNGHTVQVNLPAGSVLKVGDVSAELLQFHFHAPSEERFDGKTYPMDAHLVHKTADGKLSVVAVLFEEGNENQALKPILSALPAAGKNHAIEAFDPALLLPSDRTYYRFMGSLTTPPCSDGVSWQVLRQPVEVSKEQIAAFRALYPMNARPVQPLNGRVIEVSH